MPGSTATAWTCSTRRASAATGTSSGLAHVHRWTPPMREFDFAFAFPPCTDLAVSGARWFAAKGCTHSQTPSACSPALRTCATPRARPTASRTPSARSAATGASLTTRSTRATSRTIRAGSRTPTRNGRAYGPEAGSSCRRSADSIPWTAAGCTSCRRRASGPTCAVQRRPDSRGLCSRRMCVND